MASPAIPEQPLSKISEPAEQEDRSSYIGGSEAYELLNEKQYGRGCARALAYRKLKTPEDVPSESVKRRALSMRAIFKRGHLLEDVASKLYMEDTGRTLIRRKRLVRHPEIEGAAVHTDRIITADSTHPTGDCEIKTHQEGVFLNILRNGLPPAHNLQLQWSMFCTGHTWGAFVILGVFGEMPLKYFDVKHDLALMELFRDAAIYFWEGLKAGYLPPQLPDPHDLRCRLCPYRLQCRGEEIDPEEFRRFMQDKDRKRPLVRITNPELDEALADRQLIISEIEALDHDSEADPGALQVVTRRIRELIGDVDAIEVCNHWRVYNTEGTWSGLDQERLKNEFPEAYQKCYISRRATGKRRLKVYALGEGGKVM